MFSCFEECGKLKSDSAESVTGMCAAPGLQLNFKLLIDLHEVADKHNDAQV